MMSEIKLKLHENVLLISTKWGDLIIYSSENDIGEKVRYSWDVNIDKDTDEVKDLNTDYYLGIFIAEMSKLIKKAQNYYYKLEEKNKIQNNIGIDEFFPIIIMAFYILKQIKIILRSKALGYIANDIEKNELNVAWNLFQYLLKKMPLGSELLNKVNKDKFMEDYIKVFILK